MPLRCGCGALYTSPPAQMIPDRYCGGCRMKWRRGRADPARPRAYRRHIRGAIAHRLAIDPMFVGRAHEALEVA